MHKAKVIILNTDTILFSFHPDSSKWWCIGVILKILFPVFLKYLTWIITDIVSITGTKAIINNNSGIFRYNAMPATAPPSISEPVSPINIFAGFKLNNKNPKQVPITILPNTTISFISNIIPITVKQVKIIAVTLVANPSIPSVRLIALEVASNTSIPNGIYNHIGNVI